jgi:hypothetical protein
MPELSDPPAVPAPCFPSATGGCDSPADLRCGRQHAHHCMYSYQNCQSILVYMRAFARFMGDCETLCYRHSSQRRRVQPGMLGKVPSRLALAVIGLASLRLTSVNSSSSSSFLTPQLQFSLHSLDEHYIHGWHAQYGDF